MMGKAVEMVNRLKEELSNYFLGYIDTDSIPTVELTRHRKSPIISISEGLFRDLSKEEISDVDKIITEVTGWKFPEEWGYNIDFGGRYYYHDIDDPEEKIVRIQVQFTGDCWAIIQTGRGGLHQNVREIWPETARLLIEEYALRCTYYDEDHNVMELEEEEAKSLGGEDYCHVDIEITERLYQQIMEYDANLADLIDEKGIPEFRPKED